MSSWKRTLTAVLSIVVVAILTIATGPLAAGLMAPLYGALVGMAGAATAQIAGNVLRVTDGYSWSAIRDAGIMGGLSAGFFQGLSEYNLVKGATQTIKIVNDFARAAISATLSNGVGSLVGKTHFSLRDSMVAGLSSVVNTQHFGESNPNKPLASTQTAGAALKNYRFDLSGFGGRFGGNLGSSLTAATINESIRAAVYGNRFSFSQVAQQSVGNAIGKSMFSTEQERQIDHLLLSGAAETTAQGEQILNDNYLIKQTVGVANFWTQDEIEQQRIKNLYSFAAIDGDGWVQQDTLTREQQEYVNRIREESGGVLPASLQEIIKLYQDVVAQT